MEVKIKIPEFLIKEAKENNISEHDIAEWLAEGTDMMLREDTVIEDLLDWKEEYLD